MESLKGDELSGLSREDLGHEEGLGEESLDLSGSVDDESVFGGEIVHTQNGNDVLEGLVVLQKLLGGSCDVVVLLSDDVGESIFDDGGQGSTAG
jgi:hypothetical protein